MKYIQGQDRTQTYLFPVSLDEAISPENEVRVIDLFVNSLPLEDYGFKSQFIENGRPAYHPGDLLKLFIYGYLNRIRSSRALEKECRRNIELMWLLGSLNPDHNTIANFRRDNGKSIKKVFRETVRLARHFDLIGGTLLAGDSTKLRAQNSKKNNFNQKKIDRHLEYIENKLKEYNQLVSEADGDKKEETVKEIQKQEQHKEKYHELEKQLKETGEAQVSTSDPDSRQMIIRNRITEVAYNVQTTVDAKHNLPIDYKVTNHNDSKAMGNMLQRAKTILRTNEFTALYDKGYHTGSEFDMADQLGIKVMVAIPAKPHSSQAPDPLYNVENFAYSETENTYTCPEGHRLTTNGTWHKTDNGSRFQQFKTPHCKGCLVRERCTKSAKNGKIVQRRLYAQNIEDNRHRIENNKGMYRRRQAIVEHPYGTIKRQWGYSYVITKKHIHHARADVGLMMIAYNLRRILNILGKDVLQKYLQTLLILFFCQMTEIWLKIMRFKEMQFFSHKLWKGKLKGCNPIILNQNLIVLLGL